MHQFFFFMFFFLFIRMNGYATEVKQQNIPYFQYKYQDILIDEKVVRKGPLECEKRYKAIQPILNLFKRPITVLDLGAAEGYFSFKIAKDYESICVMVEDGYVEMLGNTGTALQKLCEINDYSNVILLKKKSMFQI